MIVQEVNYLVPASVPIFPAYSRIIRNNIENTAFNALVEVIITGTANYTIEVNSGRVDDNPQNYIGRCTFGQVVPDELPDGSESGWYPIDNDFDNQTTNSLKMMPFPFNFMRIRINSGDPYK